MDPPCGRPRTFPALLESRALAAPDRIAFRFLVDGESDEQTLTYEALDRRARQIAAALLGCARPGDRALLIHPPGLEFVAALFGALYAGVIAVPAYPPLPATLARVLPRLAHLASDAAVRVILTCAASKKTVDAAIAAAEPLRGIDVLVTDRIDEQAGKGWNRQEPDPESIAILQYTSGSTAQPRGVRLSHSNLMHNSEQICRLFEHSSDSVGVVWLPPYHDMGLTGGILQPVFAGFPVTLFSPFAFLQRPVRWLQAITRQRATGSGGPNFAYDVCVRKITAEQRATLDLSSWRVAFNGAERVHGNTMRRFAQTFAECGFNPIASYPCYGLAEATLLASGGTATTPPTCKTFSAPALQQREVVALPDTEPDTIELVGLGRAIPDQQIAIVDPDTRLRCPNGCVGEIWLSGPSVAQGYWMRPGETERVFHAHIADSGEGPFLRTGDLGFLDAEELFVTGRLQDLIVIRGRNHHPEDIEASVETSDNAIRAGGAAAFSVDVDGEEQVVVMVEIDRRSTTSSTDVEVAVRRAAAGHGLSLCAVLFMEPGEIPRTTSGKIQRHACRAVYVGRTRVPAQEGAYVERGHHAER